MAGAIDYREDATDGRRRHNLVQGRHDHGMRKMRWAEYQQGKAPPDRTVLWKAEVHEGKIQPVISGRVGAIG